MLRRLQCAVLGTGLAYLLASSLFLGLRLERRSQEPPSLPNAPPPSSADFSSLSLLLGKNAGTVQLQAVPPRGSAAEGRPNKTRGPITLHQEPWVVPASVQDNPNLPRFSSLFDSHGNVTGDVQFLLDFAIVGFGKCGTSTLMHWLSRHSEVRCFQEEIWELMYGSLQKLVQMLYEQGQRCYKCPADITQARIMNVYRMHWPRTKLLVGIRHPVRFFESLYNFRVQNAGLDEPPMPDPLRLMGRCGRGMRQTCTDMANYAFHLIRLGKQHYEKNATDVRRRRPPTPLEAHIVGRYKRAAYNVTALEPLPNPLFLFAVEELADKDIARQAEFRRAVQTFLGLSTPLPPLIHYAPGRRWTEKIQRERNALKMDICQNRFVPLRSELMRLAVQNSAWISEFISLPTVSVASESRMLEVLESWTKDPCTNRTYRLDAERDGSLHVRPEK